MGYLLFLWLLGQTAEQPFRGVTHITLNETTPRPVTVHIVKVDLRARGIHVKLTPSGGSRETVRETTVEFLNRQHAQVAVNAHFFLPFPSTDMNSDVAGLAASEGNVYSACESPSQSYALVANAPAINIDRKNHAAIVHCLPGSKQVMEHVTLWTTVAGSAQIVTNGVKTIPSYKDAEHPDGVLTPSATYTNAHSWYDLPRARTAIGLSRDNRTLLLMVVDEARGTEANGRESRVTRSGGMTVGEVADILIANGAYNALNLDGGGSTSLAIAGHLVNQSSDNVKGRAVASNLAIFARPIASQPSR